jgi:hypothetical protein
VLIILDSSGVEIERVEDVTEASTAVEVEYEPQPELGLAIVESSETECPSTVYERLQ